jgi:uncharacterized DUF497 family protein
MDELQFEWDENKNQQNIRKHHLDFQDITTAFYNPMLIKLDTRYHYNEERYIAIGSINTCEIVVVYTERQQNRIRIISARKALKHESEYYYKNYPY